MLREEQQTPVSILGNLSGANPQQKEIIHYLLNTSPSEQKDLTLIMAFPGTGKTTTIFQLLQELMRNKGLQIQSSKVLFLSFNKQNITDLNLKINQISMIADQAGLLQTRIHTFHSFAVKVTRKEKVINKQEENDIRNKILESFQITEKEKKYHFKYVIENLFTRGGTLEDWQQAINRESAQCSRIGAALRTYIQTIDQKYSDQKVASFDYSLIKAVEMLANKQDNSGMKLAENKLLIVDEFQDMNGAQIKIIQAIIKQNKQMKLAMFGDIDQNIYEWRGSKMHVIDDFINQFSGKIKVMRLLESQRLTASCLSLSINLINSNEGYKKLRQSNKYYGECQAKAVSGKQDFKPVITKFESEISQAVQIVDQIEILHYEKGVPFDEIAILFQKLNDNSLYSKIRTEILRRKSDPTKKDRQIYYQVYNQCKVFQKPIIKYLLAIFGYWNNQNKMSIRREIQVLAGFEKIEKKNPILAQCIRANFINRPLQKHKRWCNLYQKLMKIKQILDDKTLRTFRDVCVASFDYFKKRQDMNEKMIDEDIQEFLELTSQYLEEIDIEERRNSPVGSMIKFIYQIDSYKISKNNSANKNNLTSNQIMTEETAEHVFQNREKSNESMIEEQNEGIKEQLIPEQPQQLSNTRITSNKQNSKVQMLTIFGSKGLTFRAVFLCSMNYLYASQFAPDMNNRLPQKFHLPHGVNDLKIEDVERIVKNSSYQRLIYTAITRSSHYLFISSSKEDRNCAKIKKEHPLFSKLREWLVKKEDYKIVPYDEHRHGVLNAKIRKHQRIQQINHRQ